MKNKIECAKRLSLLAALIALIGFSFTSCKEAAEPTSAKYVSTDNDGNKYELVITKAPNRTAYTPQDGDTYVLTITLKAGGTQISKGTVKVNESSFSLTPKKDDGTDGAKFTIITSGTGIEFISGNITLTDGNTVIPKSEQGETGPAALYGSWKRDDEINSIFVFNTNGTWKVEAWGDDWKGTFTAVGNKLTLTLNGYEIPITYYVKGKTLTLIWLEGVGGDGIPEIYTKL